MNECSGAHASSAHVPALKLWVLPRRGERVRIVTGNDIVKFGGLSGLVDKNRRHAVLLVLKLKSVTGAADHRVEGLG